MRLWIKVVVCLAVFTGWVRWRALPQRIFPKYRHDEPVFLYNGNQVPVLFERLPPRASPEELRIALLGDSSVGGTRDALLATPLYRELVARSPGRPVRLLNFTFVGLYAQDALLFAAKAAAVDADLIVWAVSPRVVPTAPLVPFTTKAGQLGFEWDIMSRAGPGVLFDFYGSSDLGRALVTSLWLPVRFRGDLGRSLLVDLAPWLRESWRIAIGSLLPAEPQLPQTMPWNPTTSYQWPREHHRLGPPVTATMRALERVVRLCAAERRCLIYQIPVNPSAVRGFEPGLLDDFVTHVTALTGSHGVPFVDLRAFGKPENFKISIGGRPDAIHPTPAGQAVHAPIVADAIVTTLAERVR